MAFARMEMMGVLCSIIYILKELPFQRGVFMVWQPSESSSLLNHRACSWLCA
ncbi:hypothetical protein HanRHA438_Chr02g0062751 [Helianthus annuus]|nr:hypothetical protein HanRHA438_Chr02g0062751 [Helianthus annuus]